jgi:hypothetical protein
MFFQTSPWFSPSCTRGLFAVHSAGRFINAGGLSGFGMSSKKSLSVRVFDLAFAVASKSAGSYVIPVLSLMGETN